MPRAAHPRSKMNDANDVSLVRAVLEAAGVRAERVPTAQAKRCDLWAEDDAEHYLIEVKGFHDNPAIHKALRETGESQSQRRLDYLGTVAGDVSDALTQLRETAQGHAESLWLVALLARTAYGPDVTVKQILGTLYGTRQVMDMDSPTASAVSCLYFSHSAFFRHPDLDGAMVIGPKGSMLCLNDFGRRVDRLRRSPLGRFFAERGALHDAASSERDLHILVADCDADRDDEAKVLQYLEQKYKLKHLVSLAPVEYSATVLVPRPPPETDATL